MIPIVHTLFDWPRRTAVIGWADGTLWRIPIELTALPISLQTALTAFDSLRWHAYSKNASNLRPHATKILFDGYDLDVWMRAAHHAPKGTRC